MSGIIASSEFKSAWWLANKHGQTLWPSLLRRRVQIELNSERLTLPDGDFVDLAWTRQKSDNIVIILHGLEGSIDSSYARGVLSAIQAKGWQGVLMHFRGCSGVHNLKDHSYHSGETGDLRFLIQTLRSRHPQAKLAAVGYSIGGNVLLKYLGETKNDSYLDAAVAISVPYLLANSSVTLENGFSKLYQRHLLKRLHDKTRSKFKNKPAPFNIAQMKDWQTFRSFDQHITAPLHGFAGSTDYYVRNSSRQFLKYISTPTLLIHSKDDPFMTLDALPDAKELSSSTRMELTDRGGHVGFVNGNAPWSAQYWLEQRIPAFLAHHLD